MHITSIGKIHKTMTVPISLVCPKIVVDLYKAFFFNYSFKNSLAFSQNLSSFASFSNYSLLNVYSFP